MVNEIPGQNSPVLIFSYHLPKLWTDRLAHVNGKQPEIQATSKAAPPNFPASRFDLPRVDEIVLWGHYAYIFPISHWFLIVSVLHPLCFTSTDFLVPPMQKSLRLLLRNPLSWGTPPAHIISHQIWLRLHDRWGDPPYVTSPIWGLPPPCKKALRVPQMQEQIWLPR